MGKLFGTNGVRGYANKDMNAELALKLGKALGTFLEPGDTVLVGRDSRTSGPMLVSALAAGLASTGVRVHDAGVTPTPALQYAVKHGEHAAGAVVTASHNPPEFNGIKFIDGDGTEYPAEKEERVEEFYFTESFRAVPWDELEAPAEARGVNEAYVEGILRTVDVDAIRAREFRVVLDASNGAGSLTAPYVLRRLGCHVITLNCQPDGTFPGHDSEPTPENVRDLVKSVTAFDADLGVVQDGDADRCVFVTEEGEYVYGDRTLCLAATQAVKEKGGGVVVTPVSSSSIVEESVSAHGGSVIYTKVGAPIVARRMMQENAALGGEDNGGVIWPEFQHCRDAGMTLAKVLEFMAKEGKPLSQLLAALPEASLEKAKVECPNEKKAGALKALVDAHASEKVDTTDGVKITKSDGSWVLVRPSGTEPIFRVYAEAKTPEAAAKLREDALAEIRGIIEKTAA